MSRFATIDLNSGFVWWVGEADSPEAACYQSDLESGGLVPDELRRIRISLSELNTTGGGYAVYEVPPEFDVTDGQDPDAIDAVQQHPLAGYFP